MDKRTLDCRDRRFMDPFQGRTETFEILWSLSTEVAKAQGRRDGMTIFTANRKLDNHLSAQGKGNVRKGPQA